jgi:membrane associated rhomboid family serine protease
MQDGRYSPYRVQFSLGGPLTPAVKLLLILTGAGFLLQTLLSQVMGMRAENWLGLVPSDVKHRFCLWQPVTYLFLHGGLLHLGVNLLVLWMFGCELERMWGRRSFLRYYLVCGVGAGLCIAFLPSFGATPHAQLTPTIGASGALYGLLLAYGLLFPNRQILLWFILPIKAKHFVFLIGALAFYATLTQPGSGISHLGHLSGLVVGYFYLRGPGHLRQIRLSYLKWKLKRLKKRFRIIDGTRDPEEPPYLQ